MERRNSPVSAEDSNGNGNGTSSSARGSDPRNDGESREGSTDRATRPKGSTPPSQESKEDSREDGAVERDGKTPRSGMAVSGGGRGRLSGASGADEYQGSVSEMTRTSSSHGQGVDERSEEQGRFGHRQQQQQQQQHGRASQKQQQFREDEVGEKGESRKTNGGAGDEREGEDGGEGGGEGARSPGKSQGTLASTAASSSALSMSSRSMKEDENNHSDRAEGGGRDGRDSHLASDREVKGRSGVVGPRGEAGGKPTERNSRVSPSGSSGQGNSRGYYSPEAIEAIVDDVVARQ